LIANGSEYNYKRLARVSRRSNLKLVAREFRGVGFCDEVPERNTIIIAVQTSQGGGTKVKTRVKWLNMFLLIRENLKRILAKSPCELPRPGDWDPNEITRKSFLFAAAG
jgi:hypothetical protein